MYKNDWLGILAVIVVGLLLLPGCGYRYAIVKKQVCTHPENQIVKTERVRKARYTWQEDEVLTDIKEVVNRGVWSPTINPLHWHRGKAVHEKCLICGQKFCSFHSPIKRINKIELVK